MKDTYLQYGIPIELVDKLESIRIPKTTLQSTSRENLKRRYGLKDEEITLLKDAIERKPIDKQVLEALLENSNFTCCICRGTKSKSYIIHHIREYSISQDNSYTNLAVLCPDDHDLAHKKGRSLTAKITPEQIVSQKNKWEEMVRNENIKTASRSGNIIEIDFLNIPRIVELYKQIFRKTPTTSYTDQLSAKGLITKESLINEVSIHDTFAPFIFFSPHGSAMLRFHYYEMFQEILGHLDFQDLDSILNKKSFETGLIGKFCFYVGGLYSSRLPDEITSETEPMTFYFKRKHFQVNFLVDPKYFCSNSAKWRTLHRGTYMIFGRVRNVNVETVDAGKKIVLDLRPYCFGLPEFGKDRVPSIAFRHEIDEIFGDDFE